MADMIFNLWSRIGKSLESQAAAALEMLQSPADEEDILQLGETLGVVLPDDLKNSLRAHNGCPESGLFPSSDSLGIFTMGFSPLSIQQIVAVWQRLNVMAKGGEFEGCCAEPDDGIRADWWNPGWIPIADNGGGDYQCVDLVPTEAGTRGQIIGVWHDDVERHLIAPSLSEYLRQIADGFDKGALRYDENEGSVSTCDDDEFV